MYYFVQIHSCIHHIVVVVTHFALEIYTKFVS